MCLPKTKFATVVLHVRGWGVLKCVKVMSANLLLFKPLGYGILALWFLRSTSSICRAWNGQTHDELTCWRRQSLRTVIAGDSWGLIAVPVIEAGAEVSFRCLEVCSMRHVLTSWFNPSFSSAVAVCGPRKCRQRPWQRHGDEVGNFGFP